MHILANDGISASGKEKLESAGFKVTTDRVNQEDIADFINQNEVSILLVRSATTVRKDLIDACPGLKFIGRGGVGMDNIDVKYARERDIIVANTPDSSSQSVAELVMGRIFALARFTYDADRMMPEKGHREFKSLKKKYGKGRELRGKTLGIIGFGRIGKALAGYALGCGMKVLVPERESTDPRVSFHIDGYGDVEVEVAVVDMETLLRNSDVVSVHVPAQSDGKPVLTKKEFAMMKPGAFLVDAARGGVICEDDLLDALNNGRLAGAAMDVYENEPQPREDILHHPKIALSPHIGASTVEAQERIGLELADRIISKFGTQNR